MNDILNEIASLKAELQKANDIISGLEQQRNLAANGQVSTNVQLLAAQRSEAAKDAKIADLEKQIADLKAAATATPPANGHDTAPAASA